MDTRHIATVNTGARYKVPIAAWVHRGTEFIATTGLLAGDVVVWSIISTRKEV